MTEMRVKFKTTDHKQQILLYYILSISTSAVSGHSSPLDATLQSSWTPVSAARTGTLTNYGGPWDKTNPYEPSFGLNVGGCGYGRLPYWYYPFFRAIAFDPNNPIIRKLASFGCGSCWRISCATNHKAVCPYGRASIVAVVTDICPSCGQDHIDMNYLSFAKIASPNNNPGIVYQRVLCNVPADLKILVQEYHGPWMFIRINPKTTGRYGVIVASEMRCDNSPWQRMKNAWGATWQLDNSPGNLGKAGAYCMFRFWQEDGAWLTTNWHWLTTGKPGNIATGKNFGWYNARGVQDTDGNHTAMFDNLDNNITAEYGSHVNITELMDVVSDYEDDEDAEAVYHGGPDAEPCTDIPPHEGANCTELAASGKCGEQWMVDSCMESCERCMYLV